MQRTLKLYRLPEETKTPGFRPLEGKDVEQAYQLLNKVIWHRHCVVLVKWSDLKFMLFTVSGKVPSDSEVRRGRFPALVPAAPRHRRRLRRRERRHHHGHGELLHVAVDGDASPSAQVAEGGVLVLQRVHRHAVEPADERRPRHGEELRLRRVQRARPHGEQDVPRAAQVRHRRRQLALLPL